MIKILASDFFLNFGVPLITNGVSVLFKIISRSKLSFKKEDLAIGIETSTTAILLLLTDTISKFKKSSQNLIADEATKQSKIAFEATKNLIQNLDTNVYATKNLVQKLELAVDSTNSLVQKIEIETTLSSMPETIVLSGWFCAAIFIGISSISLLVRRFGWKTDDDINLFGILVPNAFGLGVLYFVVSWIKN